MDQNNEGIGGGWTNGKAESEDITAGELVLAFVIVLIVAVGAWMVS